MIGLENLQRIVEDIEGVNETVNSQTTNLYGEAIGKPESLFNEPKTPRNMPQYAVIHKEYGIDDAVIRINTDTLIAKCYNNGRFTAMIDMEFGTLEARNGQDKVIKDGIMKRDEVIDAFKKECDIDSSKMPLWVAYDDNTGYLEVDGVKIEFEDKIEIDGIEISFKSFPAIQKEMLELPEIKEILTDFAEIVKNSPDKSAHKKDTVVLE